MGAEQLKKILHLRIEQADDAFLRILYAMTQAYTEEHAENTSMDQILEAVPLPPNTQPMTAAALKKELDEANAQFERGEFIMLEDLRKESEQW